MAVATPSKTDTMKKARIIGPRQAEIVDVPTPKAKGDWALVKIHVAPMCTEYEDYDAGEAVDCLGHEAAGEVVEVDQPGYVNVGDRVVVMPQYPCGICSNCIDGEYIHCEHTIDIKDHTGGEEGNETYAQYILKPSWLLPKIPDGVSYEHAGMLCCGLGPTFGAMERMNVNAFDTVLILGMGPVGLGGVINAVHRNARVIAGVGNPYRANLAKELGADEVVNPRDKDALSQIMDLTGGIGVDKAIDCAGNADAQRLMIDALRRNGQGTFVGESGAFQIQVSDDMIRKGLTLHGAWHYNLNGIAKLFQLIQREGQRLDKMITHSFPLSQVQEAWDLQLKRECGKVLIYPWK